MSASVLIAASNFVVQQFIRRAVEGRGHGADVASDGFTAVQLFKKNNYEMTFIDDEIPGLDGYATARVMRDLIEDRKAKLYALSTDVAALKQRTGADEIFDSIIPKPLDVFAMVRLIEEAFCGPRHGQLMNATLRVWREVGLNRRPVAKVLPTPSLSQTAVLKPWFEIADESDADIILLTSESAAVSLSESRLQSDNFLLPVVELEGINSGFADAKFDVHRKDTWQNLAATIKSFEAKRARLSESARCAQDLDIRLLANLFLSERPLEPTVDPSTPICAKPQGFNFDVILATERLANRGLLAKQFVDRFHSCSGCGSSRLNVREECPGCRSANLQQTQLVHHFRCAHQAPEAYFRSGANLICPKCSQHLRHYGGDYDKPGSVLICNDCHALSSDPAIGFSCFDCGAHVDGDAAETRDLFRYSLTARAEAFLTQPVSIESDKMFSLNVVPRSIGEAIDKVLLENSESLKGLAIIEVEYRAASNVVELEGCTAFASLRRLFVDNMANVLADHAHIISHNNADYLVVYANDEVISGTFVRDLFNHCQAGLSRDLEPSYRIIDPAALRRTA